jgi:hypothetical protein
MCHPPALVGCCEGKRHCARKVYGHRAKWTASGQWVRAWSSCLRALFDRSWMACLAANLEVVVYPTEGELLACIVACLMEGIVVEASFVAMVGQDLDSVFCHVLFKDKLGGKCFVGLVVKLEVDKTEVAVVVDKDSSALVALLGEFAF